MVDFIRKRLQVFVSSTFSDLRDERQAAVEAILTAGHIPAGMELFTSGDESQMEVIKQWIDESDVYLLILGGRYGSVEAKSGKSYTHLEYEYALHSDKPMFACVMNESALEAKVKSHGTEVIELDNPAPLKRFRAEVKTRVVKFWDDKKDIKIAVGETLAHFARREELTGWVRAAKEVDLERLLNEIARLSQENAHLRSLGSSSSEPTIAGFTFQELLELLKGKKLLHFLEHYREELSAPRGLNLHNSRECRELTLTGLLNPHPGGTSYFLSEEGKRFLSRLDLLRMRDRMPASNK
jgi:hypothetical protein